MDYKLPILDKESRFELQKIDCNCNDCKFMDRNQEKFKKSLETHYKWQFDYFNTIQNNLYIKAADWVKRSFLDNISEDKRKRCIEKSLSVHKEASKLKFQFDKKEATINFGVCSEFNEDVSFIPNTCQIETQDCFKHRRE